MARSWDYQALLIQDALESHQGTKPGSEETCSSACCTEGTCHDQQNAKTRHLDAEQRAPAACSWDYQALLIQETLGSHPGTRPGSAEAQRQMTEAAVATREAASNASAPGHPRIAVDPILYPVRLPGQSMPWGALVVSVPQHAGGVVKFCNKYR